MEPNTDYSWQNPGHDYTPPPPAKPPLQLTEQWVELASPTSIDVAVANLQLHAYLGGALDADGWPIGRDGKRLDVPGRSR